MVSHGVKIPCAKNDVALTSAESFDLLVRTAEVGRRSGVRISLSPLIIYILNAWFLIRQNGPGRFYLFKYLGYFLYRLYPTSCKWDRAFIGYIF
ncbi:MAG: hypothetical protein A7316_10385 [Candidatus Altiarchaeales archaeon WOR_SM1_86-2]|nr:MAG: hypothetical protein A7316_10385 [Candidatus Altiarchaeales archaeon WOR_SM1_86-2]